MNKKKKVGIFDFVWIIIAGIFFSLRYVKIINVDWGILGSANITFVQKLSDCSLPIVNALDTCKNIGLINTIWWVVIGVLVVVQLVVLANKLKK
ncbi:MAG: hypothetical protein WCY27_03460 [archaeon]|jgi:hypothetical protein|nr:hypothetical protein [archaeon]MDD2477490.1 hypothetical protein [Candidatus ainarchaeum sp.]MDD3084766.1 hypothetical protein [Candidatus ainarchaeum sp.]MDD4221442.1 hypothetical protein [Candidatus ainarchaeum sp.]MDD4662406.1 hypothetical protein [Candidatus ainarchaeum sp.]